MTGNPGELNQVWTNLLDNAIDAIDEDGEITVRTSRAAGQAVVEILDNGCGIPADVRPRVFDPFFTTKDVGGGTGLGLDIVRRIVERHLGEVAVESEPGRTRFEVRAACIAAHRGNREGLEVAPTVRRCEAYRCLSRTELPSLPCS